MVKGKNKVRSITVFSLEGEMVTSTIINTGGKKTGVRILTG